MALALEGVGGQAGVVSGGRAGERPPVDTLAPGPQLGQGAMEPVAGVGAGMERRQEAEAVGGQGGPGHAEQSGAGAELDQGARPSS